jgi:hypothetical protein
MWRQYKLFPEVKEHIKLLFFLHRISLKCGECGECGECGDMNILVGQRWSESLSQSV